MLSKTKMNVAQTLFEWTNSLQSFTTPPADLSKAIYLWLGQTVDRVGDLE